MTRPPVLAGLVLVGLGTVLLLGQLGVVDDLALLWPLLLLTLGGWLLLGQRARRTEGSTPEGAGSGLDVVTVFSDRRVRVAPGGGASGSVVTVFGDVDLDLTAATPGTPARLDGVTVFGDVEVHVPEDWRVTVGGATLFGGIRVDDGALPEPDAPQLRLELVTVFGDVRVRRTPVPAAPTA